MRNILEELTQKAADVGQVKFSKSTFSDPHIRKTLQHISKETGKPVKEIQDKIDEELKKFVEIQAKAPLLYHTIAINIIEGEVFKVLKKVPVKGAPDFDPTVFSEIWQAVKREHRSLFPLRNFVNHKALHNPRKIFIPSHDAEVQKEFSDIDTACATPDGRFVFNTEFMQRLLNYAHLKNIKPKGKKYENRGGDIPTEYAYIEFLIMHEFMHYTYADFHYGEVYEADPTVANWVGDFRSNYDLVKSEHEQLPIGLYNDLINLDRQKNWKEMYDIVKAEFDKLEPPWQKKLQDMLGGIMQGKHRKGEKGGAEGATQEQAEKGAQKARGKGQKSDEKAKSGDEGKEAGTDGKGDKGGRGAKRPDSKTAIDYTKFSPSMSWQALISKLVKTASREETTYQKSHRRSIVQSNIAAQLGKAPVKPADIDIESNLLKLVIVVDSSGSMTDQIERIYANINNLLRQHGSDLPAGFVLVKFSDAHKMYLCSLAGGGSYKEIKSPHDKSKTPLEKGNLKKLFSEHYGSSTNFDRSLTDDLLPFLKDNFNVLIVTDSDITGSENLQTFNSFYKNGKGRIFIIAKDKSNYHYIIKALQDKSSAITHM